MGKDVFLSVGAPANKMQEDFIVAIEGRLRAEGLIPNTVGRNTFSVDKPLTTVAELMDRCVGTVVIALERSYYPSGLEKRGGAEETKLHEIKLTTPWNQIEASLAYSRGLPLLVLVEKGLRQEGLLEQGNDWYVQTVPLDVNCLNSEEFNGILASWKDRIEEFQNQSVSVKTTMPSDVEKMTIGQFLGAIKLSHLGTLLVSLVGLAAGAFGLGAHFFPL